MLPPPRIYAIIPRMSRWHASGFGAPSSLRPNLKGGVSRHLQNINLTAGWFHIGIPQRS